jgi:diguanylate cyclase (GGDEF)-like protein
LKVKRFTHIHLWIISITFLIVIFIGGWSATKYLGNIARQEIIKENEASFSILSTYILSELQKFEGAVKSLASSPWISLALISHGKQDIEQANCALDRYNSAFNSSVAYLMDTSGVTVASSNRNEPDSFVGKLYGFRSYFQAAMQGNQGRYYAIGVTTDKRGFYTSFPVRNDNGEIIGVIALKKDVDEWEERFSRYTNCFFIDPHGIIFLSSEKALLFASLWPINEKIKQELLTSKQFDERLFKALLSQEVTDKMDIILDGSHYIAFRKVIDPEGWSIVLMSPTDRITVYKSVGVISVILIYTLIAIPLIVIYRTARSAEEIRALLITDQLTGLYNRRGFIALVEQQLKIVERTKEGAILLFADLDGLKWINDNLGHNKGDGALVEAASIFKEIFRKSDIIARMGGDEFAVFALSASQEYSVLLENRLQHLIDSRNIVQNRDYKLSISIGVVYHDPAYPCSIDELLTRADAAMYEHKKSKRMADPSHTLK